MKKKESILLKAKIIIILKKGGAVVHGDGYVEALRTNDGKRAHLVAYLNKDFPKK